MPLKGYRSRTEALSVAPEVEGMPRISDWTWPCGPCVWTRQCNPVCCLLHSPCYTALLLPFLSVYCPIIATRQIPPCSHEKQQPSHTDDRWSWGDNLTMTADSSLASIRLDAGEDRSQVGMWTKARKVRREMGGDTGDSTTTGAVTGLFWSKLSERTAALHNWTVRRRFAAFVLTVLDLKNQNQNHWRRAHCPLVHYL